MQTINTKYLGATNTKGGRIKATHSGKSLSVTLSYDHALGADENHLRAATALRDKLGWKHQFYGGSNQSGDGYVFVIPDRGMAIPANPKDEDNV